MVRTKLFYILIILFSVVSISWDTADWGFYAHRKINELAVYTLPPPLISFFKKNIEYISDHAVDPDMRRHASKYEAVRHYIDIDHWGGFPFDQVPRNHAEAILKFGSLKFTIEGSVQEKQLYFESDSARIDFDAYRWTMQKDSFLFHFRNKLMPLYYAELWSLPLSPLNVFGWQAESVEVVDNFSDYGILPFYLLQNHYRLVKAMKEKNGPRILQLAAEYGHYIGDAHVPLHTTENYNGQLTGQDGIHAFWESRIPELFADKNYNFFVGRAEYVSNLKEYYWDIILDSHVEVDSVLGIEKRLRATFPLDKQYCYTERNNRTARLPCPEFAEAYQKAMNGMVEERMQSTIKALGSLWYTAWVQAGQPDLNYMITPEEMKGDTTTLITKPQLGRTHSG